MYECPEIMEIGAAERLTRGLANMPYEDVCSCSRQCDVVVDDE